MKLFADVSEMLKGRMGLSTNVIDCFKIEQGFGGGWQEFSTAHPSY